MYSDYFVGSFAERLCLGDVNKPTPAVISPGVGAGYFISPSRKGKKKKKMKTKLTSVRVLKATSCCKVFSPAL